MLLIWLSVVYFFAAPESFDSEILLWQMTMPGLEEELYCRCLVMGLLLGGLRSDLRFRSIPIGPGALWVTSLHFGLIHGLQFNADWTLELHLLYVLGSALFGWFFGWLVLRTRSVLFPLFAHNLLNTGNHLIRMFAL